MKAPYLLLLGFLVACTNSIAGFGGGSFYKGDDAAIHDNVSGEISALTAKGTPVGNDMVLIEDSAASDGKKKATLQAIFDALGGLSLAGSGEIAALTDKPTPVGADLILIEDSAAGNAKKKASLTATFDAMGGSPVLTDQTYAQCIAAAASAQVGDVCYPTDSAYWLLCRVAGAWVHRMDGLAFDLTPPPSTGWTAYNSGIVTTVGGVRRLTMAPNTPVSPDWAGEWRDHAYTPGTDNFYIELIVRQHQKGGPNYNSNNIMAAGLYEQADADILIIGGAHDQTGIAYYSAPGTIAFEYVRGEPASGDDDHFLRIRWEVAANRTARLLTADGTAVSWNVGVGTHSEYLTPDGAWWGGRSAPASTLTKVYDLVHYEEGLL